MDIFYAMRVFVRVVETGSFTATADSLNVSTAHISRSIALLEDSIKARLIQRSTRSQALTEVGARYLESCKEIIAKVEDAASEAGSSFLKPSGCLKVHSVTEFGLECLMPLVVEYSKCCPEVTLDLTLARQRPHLIDDNLDVLITLSRNLPDSDVVGQHLGSFFSVACASQEYLNRRGVPVTPSDLIRHTCLRLTDSMFSDRWVFEGSEGEMVIDPGETFKVNLSEALAFSASAGMGICLLPSFVASKPLREGSLVRVLPEYQLHERSVYAIYSSRRYLDAKIKTWVDHLKAQLPKVFARHLSTVNSPRYWVGRAAKSQLG
ncbi:HTH-type transcriptional regulator DmlR [compost metagenome]|uniref:HTH-type transcriptional regulator DmlR n=1 Tax=Pseudomonas fluorescens TaxID=294 RepID=A0A5E7RL12_PSEFL|nr:LysR family transcriptional regulator [Pseudomonas fluorescens]VVP75211.1 HTH-type transcriptional regulator DmlR [Pseudomonas fluorescens]